MLEQYDGRMLQIRDRWGQTFTGMAESLSTEYIYHEYGKDDEGLLVNGILIYAGNIEHIEEKPDIAILRATDTWQQAGAYYVRIQAMAKKHHITLRREFDEHIDKFGMAQCGTVHTYLVGTSRQHAFYILKGVNASAYSKGNVNLACHARHHVGKRLAAFVRRRDIKENKFVCALVAIHLA